ncbi:MAG: T9SS type A sorting domain-containing protein, partial [Calditrichaeota bacterium]|nr:T9SS type A sorting domain-containing protein [Calditrichota bacterium]
YDMLGRKVATLVDGQLPAGSHALRWDASGLPSGVYIYRLQVNGDAQSRKMVLLR